VRCFALLQVTTGRAMPQRRRVDTGTGRPGAGVGRRVVAWRWRGGGRGLWRVRCFALLQVTTGRAMPQRRRVDTGTGRPGAGVGRRVVAWRWRGGGRGLWRVVGRGLWRARCFALLQVTAGRAWPQRRRAGHWHGTGASQGRALSLARGGDGANESSSAGRAGQGAGAGRGGGVVRGCGRAPVPLVFRAARWRRGGRGQQRRTSTGGHWRVALLGDDGANESSSAGRAGQGTGAGRGGAVVHGAAGARGMGGGGVGVVRGGVHVALLSSPVLA
jgi:hypothetical protein